MNKYLFVGLVFTLVFLCPSLYMYSMIGDVHITSRPANIDEIESGSRAYIEKHIEITPMTFFTLVGLMSLFVGLILFSIYVEDYENKKVGLKHG